MQVKWLDGTTRRDAKVESDRSYPGVHGGQLTSWVLFGPDRFYAQYELGNFKAISADVRINPDLSAYTWIEFYRAIPPGTQLQGAYLGMFYTLTGLHVKLSPRAWG